jgi:uncharacterized protein YndB with AHSA1/START domain
MPYSCSVDTIIHAPVARVWEAITDPAQVKQYFFGTDLVTSWEPGSPIYFRGEWEGTPYEDKGTVLRFEPEQLLQYNYYSSWSDLPDLPENYMVITYEVEAHAEGTLYRITQDNADTEEKAAHSAESWKGLLVALKNLLEA